MGLRENTSQASGIPNSYVNYLSTLDRKGLQEELRAVSKVQGEDANKKKGFVFMMLEKMTKGDTKTEVTRIIN